MLPLDCRASRRSWTTRHRRRLRPPRRPPWRSAYTSACAAGHEPAGASRQQFRPEW